MTEWKFWDLHFDKILVFVVVIVLLIVLVVWCPKINNETITRDVGQYLTEMLILLAAMVRGSIFTPKSNGDK